MKLLAFGLFLFQCLQCFAASDLQVIALHEMRMMLTDSFNVLKDWNDKQVSPCYFSNIICDQDGKVVEITLSSSGLSGVLSPSIAKLTTLQQLLLDGNSITGGMPQELGNLSNLMTLKPGRNRLNGSIPESFGLLLELQNLDLSENRLSGEIPKSLSSLTSLKEINLADNSLTIEMPLQMLQLAKYNFTGNYLYVKCGQNSTPCEGSNGHKTKLWVIATVVPPVAAFFCFIFYFGWIRRHRKGKVSLQDRSKVNEHRDEELVWGTDGRISEFTFFDFSQVLEATSNFSDENKLGQGGFGPVYKPFLQGQFPDRLEIAVKRLASHSGQGFTEFKNEIRLIDKLQHTNLVRLLGCCSQGEDEMLVYEYLPNKSLNFFIFGSSMGFGWSEVVPVRRRRYGSRDQVGRHGRGERATRLGREGRGGEFNQHGRRASAEDGKGGDGPYRRGESRNMRRI